MTEKREVRFYTRGMKRIVLGIMMGCGLLTLVCGGIIFAMLNTIGTFDELLRGVSSEDTMVFSEMILDEMSQVHNHLNQKTIFTTEGKLDLSKTIDITNLNAVGKQQKKETTFTVESIQKYVKSQEYMGLYELLSNDSFEEDLSYLSNNDLFQENVTTVSGKTLAEYAVENKGDVSLWTLYEDLKTVCDAYQTYETTKGHLEASGLRNAKYFVQNSANGDYLTNGSWKSVQDAVDELQKNSFFIHYQRSEQEFQYEDQRKSSDASQWLRNSLLNKPFFEQEEVVIAVDSAYAEMDSWSAYREDYQLLQPLFPLLLVGLLVGILGGVICFILATVQTGRKRKGGEVFLHGIDRIPVEVCLALLLIIIVVFLSVSISITGYAIDAVYSSIAAIFLAPLFIGLYLSLVRRVKAKVLWENSICKGLMGICRRVYQARDTSKKVFGLLVPFFLLQIFLVGVLGRVGIVILILLDALVLLYVLKDTAGRQTVKTGLDNIAAGDLEYKINLSDLQGDNLVMAEAVNKVVEGLQLAVEKSMKDGRMRSELITNVSHDIKTPLTSIINYVDLLKREGIEDEKISGYIQVLEVKAQRLKHLTEDLVEASKISSGNIDLQLGRVFMQELLQQAHGEFGARFTEKGLDTVLTIVEEPVVIWADGRQMWRIFENVLGNIEKYGMPGTRVYIDLHRGNGRMSLIFKNISKEPLNINADELTERFVRGDASRTTEGSGLGLSIAKNLTEIQGGEFVIYLEGDLFKVTIEFQEMQHL